MTQSEHYRPSMAAVDAATAAWNRAEPKRALHGSSWVTTIAAMLVAAHQAEEREEQQRWRDDPTPHPDDCRGCQREDAPLHLYRPSACAPPVCGAKAYDGRVCACDPGHKGEHRDPHDPTGGRSGWTPASAPPSTVESTDRAKQ